MMKLPIVISWLLFCKMRLYAASTASVKAFIWHKALGKNSANLYETCSHSQKLNITAIFPVKRNNANTFPSACEMNTALKFTASSFRLLSPLLNAVRLFSGWEMVGFNGLSVAHGLHIGQFHVVPIKMLMFLLTLTCAEVTYRPTQTLTPQYRTHSLVSCSEICWSSHAG